MKKIITAIITATLFVACNNLFNTEKPDNSDVPDDKEKLDVPVVENPITIASPQPDEYIVNLTLSKEQRVNIDAGNVFALKCLSHLYLNEPGSVVYSPLSLMYALAMTVNGASGETAAEITRALGYGADVKALNELCKLLLNQQQRHNV